MLLCSDELFVVHPLRGKGSKAEDGKWFRRRQKNTVVRQSTDGRGRGVSQLTASASRGRAACAAACTIFQSWKRERGMVTQSCLASAMPPRVCPNCSRHLP